MTAVAKDQKKNLSPRIENRRAWHEYFSEAKLECGIVLQGSEVKSLRDGKAQLNDAFARVEHGNLILYQAHIDPMVQLAKRASSMRYNPVVLPDDALRELLRKAL